jgi:hypothetical protein
MWGLTKDGTFISAASTTHSNLTDKWLSYFGSSDGDVYRSVLLDLQKVRSTLSLELQRFQFSILSEIDRSSRILYLFQKDLMPGLNAMILESKGKRDFKSDIFKVEPYQKVIAWLFIITLNVSLLFYIYLFAIRQSIVRQQAWFQTFIIWLILEIFIVSTIVVLVSHIAIPSIIMKDLQRVKKRLLKTIQDYDKSLYTEDFDKINILHPKSFNAADYFFVSYRLASLYPSLAVSKIISKFHSPWPHQSYKKTRNLSKSYSKRFATLVRSASMILIFLLKGFLSLPTQVQDMIISLSTIIVSGKSISFFFQLYEVNKWLPLFTVIICLIFFHFVARCIYGKVSFQNVKQAKVLNLDINRKRRINDRIAAEIEPTSIALKTRRQSMVDGIKIARDLQDHVTSSNLFLSESLNACRESGNTDDSKVEESKYSDMIKICTDTVGTNSDVNSAIGLKNILSIIMSSDSESELSLGILNYGSNDSVNASRAFDVFVKPRQEDFRSNLISCHEDSTGRNVTSSVSDHSQYQEQDLSGAISTDTVFELSSSADSDNITIESKSD